MSEKGNDQPRQLFSQLPLVSLCTPTYNRRKFIPHVIEWFHNQYYPKNRIEWIIIDDGTDPIGDLVESIPEVKYFYYKEKMILGKKRNLMNSKCSGDFLVYIDDDDFYPLNRVTHAVTSLLQNPQYLVAGCSKVFVLFKRKKDILISTGPFGRNHATAATFAFRKEFLSISKFDNENKISEEKFFLKNFQIPVYHLEPLKTIIVVSHSSNTCNKDFVLNEPRKYKVQQYNPSLLTKEDYLHLKKFSEILSNKILSNNIE